MDLETFLVAVYCLVDDGLRTVLRGVRLRQRRPAPRLADSEVLAMEIAGEYLGVETDRGIHRYFRHHWPALFPALAAVHRTTFLRQAANLWPVKRLLWQAFLPRLRGEPQLSILDSVPVPVCRGLRAHPGVTWPGIIARCSATRRPCSSASGTGSAPSPSASSSRPEEPAHSAR